MNLGEYFEGLRQLAKDKGHLLLLEPGVRPKGLSEKEVGELEVNLTFIDFFEAVLMSGLIKDRLFSDRSWLEYQVQPPATDCLLIDSWVVLEVLSKSLEPDGQVRSERLLELVCQMLSEMSQVDIAGLSRENDGKHRYPKLLQFRIDHG